jgi:hypothetical protein
MQIWDSLNSRGKEQTIIKSLVWKTIIDIYKNEKKIDITSYLISIQIKKTTIFIKTNKPIINTELLTISNKIKESSRQKFLSVWVKFVDFKIKYI